MSSSRDKIEPKYEVPAGSVPVFQTAIYECPDINAGTTAVDVTGRYAVVSGRKCIVLIDLDGKDATGVDPVSSQNISASISSAALNELSNTLKQGPACKRYIRNSKYDPSSSHFNRHLTDLYALSTYQVVDVFSIEDINPLKPKFTLRGHSRAIADIEWSHSNPHLLGSSAADCLTNLWDIRDSRRPSACLTSVSGATHVRFSKTSSNLIATSHEIDVRIWDIRQPNLPLNYIAAHLQKMNGIDWNHTKNSCGYDQFITCSQDNAIKLWDMTANKIRLSANFYTRTPAWRIRFTPVSPYAILTSTLPQLRSRTECLALKLWSMKSSRYEQKKLELILGLVGHTDVIIDFDWRQKDQSSGSCEIVSWSKDQTLRVWRIDNQFIDMNVDNPDRNSYQYDADYEAECCDQSSETTLDEQRLSSVKPNSLIATESNKENASTQDDRSFSRQSSETTLTKMYSQKHQATTDDILDADKAQDEDDSVIEDSLTTSELRQEFNLINKNIPNVEFEELNSLRRVCLVVARAKNVTCRLRIALPPNYPQSECPTFTIIDSNQFGVENLSKDTKDKLIALLNETAKAQLSRSRNCIEPCLRKFIATLQKITSHSSHRKRNLSNSLLSGQMGSVDYKDDPITLSAQRDHSVPFPPTSGARFCGNLLVCFGRPLFNNATSSANGPSGESTSFSVETPRSMAQLSAQLDNMRRQGSYNLSNISISYFYYGAMRRAELQSRTTSSSQRNSLSSSVFGSASGHATSGAGGSITSSSKYLSSRSRNNTLGAHSMLAKNFKCGPVIIYDVSIMLGGISKELAEDYVFDKDVIKMCRRNSEIAAAHNRRDLVQIWSLAELSSEGVLRSYMPTNQSALKSQDNDDYTPFSFMNSCDSDFGDRPWTMHPFGSKLIQSLIDHYVYNCHDVQTAAMLVWTFSSPRLCHQTRAGQLKLTSSTPTASVSVATNTSNSLITRSGKTYSKALSNSSGNGRTNSSTLHTSTNITAANVAGSNVLSSGDSKQNDTISDEWNFVNGPEMHLYSNSWTNSTNMNEDSQWAENRSGSGSKTSAVIVGAAAVATASAHDEQLIGATSQHHNMISSGDTALEQGCLPKLNILSPDRGLQNDLIMHIYAELLYRLNLLNQRAMVLKNIGTNSAYSEIFGAKQALINDTSQEKLPNLIIQCANLSCRNNCRSVQCDDCKKFSFYCSICRLPVRGSCSICMKCQHGGHVNHFSAWFNTYDFCPTGCGCKCPTVSQDY